MEQRRRRRSGYVAIVAAFLVAVSVLPALPTREGMARIAVETISRVNDEGVEENLEPEKAETARKEDQSSERADRRG